MRDMKIGINKITKRNHKDTYEFERGDGLKRILKNIWYSDISDLQTGHANSGSSESDLVSDKKKEAVICTIIIQSR